MNGDTRIEEILEREGVYVSTTVGTSMYPMLRNRRDTIAVRPKSGRLKKYDIPLYRRGDDYVLHRVIRVLPDGGYNIRGDNCVDTEMAVPEDSIIGVLDRFWRNGKEIDPDSAAHRMYARLWVGINPIIRVYRRFRGALSRMYRRMVKKNK